MMRTSLFSAFVLASLAACGSTVTRLDMPRVASDLNVRALVGSVMVRTVSLPTYAATEEIALETAPGVITSNGKLLAADDPERSVTLTLTRQLDDILDATVGPDPWPFTGLPDVSVDVRVSDMLGSAVDGTYRMSGQYFIGGDGVDFRDSSTTFNFVVPMASPDIPGAIAAQGAAVALLAEDIARRLGR